MAESKKPAAPAAKKVVHRNASSGKLATAEAAAAAPDTHVAEEIKPSYAATVVNAVARAAGVRVTLDIDLPPEKADLITAEGTKLRLNISV